MRSKLILIVILTALAAVFGLRFLLGGPEDSWICENGVWVEHGRPSSPQPIGGCGGAAEERQASPAGVGLANPAAVYCEETGGRVRIETGPEGERGICVLPDGSECDEWLYFRGECGGDKE